MKKILSFLLALCMVFTMTVCVGSAAVSADDAEAAPGSDSPVGSYKLSELSCESGNSLAIVSSIVELGANFYLTLREDGTGCMDFLDSKIPAEWDEEGILQSGVLIRHLILPGEDLNSMDAIDFAAEEFPKGSVLFSLMSQYTPMPGLERFPELQKPVAPELNERLCAYLARYGPADGYWQEGSAATGEMIPAFDGTGL